MDAVKLWVVLSLLWAGAGLTSCALYNIVTTKPPRDYPAYCIDPFASNDLGQAVYTHCTLVPMWSTKA